MITITIGRIRTYMYQILGPNNKTVMDTFEEYKIRFNKSNDKPTDVLESILKGSNNVVALFQSLK